MSRIGYALGVFDLFQVRHLELLQQAKGQCDFLIAGVISDDVLVGGAAPVIPLAERLEIVRNIRCVDAAFPAMTVDRHEIWRVLRFDTLFEGMDGTVAESGNQSDQRFAAVGVKVVYLLEGQRRGQPTLRRGSTVDFAASKMPLWFE
jgi:glycerol-3-phosphate cytidylyltransferase